MTDLADLLRSLIRRGPDVHGAIYNEGGAINEPLSQVAQPINEGLVDLINAYRHAAGEAEIPVSPYQQVVRSRQMPMEDTGGPGFARPQYTHSFDPGAALQNAGRFAVGGGAQAATGAAGDLADLVSLGREWAEGNVSTPVAVGLTGAIALPTGVSALRALPDHVWRRPQLGHGPGNEQVGAIMYHGTPNRWAAEPGYPEGKPRFDSSTRHTGEGATAFGEGLYAAQSPATAATYKNAANMHWDYPLTVGGRPSPGGGAWEEVRVAVNSAIGDVQDVLEDGARYGLSDEAQKLLRKHADQLDLEIPGDIYAFDYPDDQLAKFLDLDAPLSEQPEVLARLKDAGLPEPYSKERLREEVLNGLRELEESPDVADWVHKDAREWRQSVEARKLDLGEMDYVRMAKDMAMDYGDATPPRIREIGAAWENLRQGWVDSLTSGRAYQEFLGPEHAQTLYEAGIPGSQFFDAGSRAAGEGTRNYVLFRPQDDAITDVRRLTDSDLRDLIGR